ncbi:Protein of unknown function (DUF3605) domain containing protein [Rhypophila sp. PSN 637]
MATLPLSFLMPASPVAPIQVQESPCPPYLLNLTEKDKQTLTIPDEEFARDSWETVKKRVQENKLDEFKRVPSQLRKYLEYNYNLKQSAKYGNVQNFILRERLRWDLASSSGTSNHEEEGLFANAENDVKILQNDWPYGIDERIVHLVVWTKFPLEDDEITWDLKPEVRRQVDGFVRRTFTSAGGVPGVNVKAPREDEVIWFKNWSSIKSIHSVEHFHVMLFDPDPEFVDHVTGGDVPLWKKRKHQQEAETYEQLLSKCNSNRKA